ncbi:MAG: hypothetical protein JO307_17205 [Bryobacterales bacterium]|nr:hypothetical protein [Bryobacterales bacterium]MBV9396792.1 hypothetical protein [Bryobacterales bacterium]
MKVTLTLVAAGLIASIAAWGHHSFAAEYDGNKPVTLKGTVVKMDWVNPHSWLHIKVTDPDGKEVEWLCETAPPNGLYRQGWRKDSLKEGEQVTVEGFRAKDASNTMTARSVVTAEGRRMFAGTANDGAPGAKQ